MISRRALLLGGALSAARPQRAFARIRRPAAAIAILVDLSETWLNHGAMAIDFQLLSRVGDALVDAAPRLPRPLIIRHHQIGASSLGQQPLCTTVYQRSLFGARDVGVISDPAIFRHRLDSECPRFILSRQPAPLTEITAAIVSAVQSMAMAGPGVTRLMIILSDFKEESRTHWTLDGIDLHGLRAILLYRTLPEDRRNPRGLQIRMAGWRRRLQERGADVQVFDENAALSAPDLTALILGR